ncbi:TPA: hypothetical protein ACPO83_001327 [Haemophilus influenzae]|uniref:hypothetical protein n=1 Tax=Haemophilus influenzae TaxID=727 RepID=UPI000E570F73|nr:hypothetical protein [Haemophilus influenzae]
MNKNIEKPTTRPVSHHKTNRKIVQIAISNSKARIGDFTESKETIIALCNDGSLWCRSIENDEFRIYGGNWFQIEEIPQG